MTKLFKLANHSTNNAHVEFDFDTNGCFQRVRLVSYSTVIFEIENSHYCFLDTVRWYNDNAVKFHY